MTNPGNHNAFFAQKKDPAKSRVNNRD